MGAAIVVPPPPTAGRTILSLLWTITIAAFLVLVAIGFAGLFTAPGQVFPGIQGVRQGSTVNGDVDVSAAGWSFTSLSPSSSGAWNPAGFLEMSSDTRAGGGTIGYWWQSFDVSGSEPFGGRVQMRMKANLGDNATSGTLWVYVSRSAQLPPASEAVGTMTVNASLLDWTATERFLVEAQFTGSGSYFLLVAFTFEAAVPGTPTSVGLDDVRLTWTTNAGVVFYLSLPFPERIFLSQDVTLFLGYYVFLIAVIVAAAVYHGVRERRLTAAAFGAPLAAIGARLRSRSAWIAVAQVWVAVTFFQVTLIYILDALGALPPSPFEIDWTLFYELANASVYEEFAFRVLPLGAPLAIGSLIARILELNRGSGAWRGTGSARRHLLGSLRFLAGGNVSRSSTKETLLAAAVFLGFSSALFGLAHLPGWGLWKVFPSFVAGLGFGYLFLRHGVTAAILAHFANDYAFALVWMDVGGVGFMVFVSLLFLGLAIAGSGFFVWYVLYAIRHLRDLWHRFTPSRRGPAGLPAGRPAPMAGHVLGGASTAGPASNPGTMGGSAPPPFLPPVPREVAEGSAGYIPRYRAPPYGYPPVRFQCPSCGWIEAHYDAGRFTCARCGKTS